MDFLDSSQLEYNSSKEWNSSRQSIILNKECEEKGIFEYLNQLDSNDKELEEKNELAEKQ